MWRCLFRPEEAWEQRGAAALVVSNLLAVLAYTFLFVVAASALDKGQAPTYGHG